MQNSMLLLTTILVIVYVAGAQAEHKYPTVAWSFDECDGSKVVPEYSLESRYYGDFGSLMQSEIDVFRTGVVGKAIYLPGKRFVIASNLTEHDCIYNIEYCNEATIVFWLKLENWGQTSGQSIIKTLTGARDLPGIYFGKGDDGNVVVYIRGSLGKTYETTFKESYILDHWSHLEIKWIKANHTINIMLNDTLISGDTHIGHTTVNSEPFPMTNLVVGETGGPSFILDELKIYYTTIIPHSEEPVYISTIGITTTMTSNSTSTTFTISTVLSTGNTEITNGDVTTTALTPSNDLTYIAVGIIGLVPVVFLSLFCCVRKRMKRNRRINNHDTVQLYEIDAEEIQPYHDDSENDK